MEMFDAPEFADDAVFVDIARDEVRAALSFAGMTVDDVYRAVECLTFQTVEQALRELVASGDVRRRGELYALPPTRASSRAHVVRPMTWRDTATRSVAEAC